MTEDQRYRVNGPEGDFVPQLSTAERDAEMARMRGRGMAYAAIARQMGVAESTAYEGVKRALNAVRAEGGEEAREMELRRLDRWQERIERSLEREYITISHGRVMRRRVTDENGEWIPILDRNGEHMVDHQDRLMFQEEDIPDEGPIFQALDRLLKISQRRAALLGLDAPVKAEVGGTIKYEIVGVSPDDM